MVTTVLLTMVPSKILDMEKQSRVLITVKELVSWLSDNGWGEGVSLTGLPGLQGAKGDKGEHGSDGKDGTNGNTILSGSNNWVLANASIYNEPIPISPGKLFLWDCNLDGKK